MAGKQIQELLGCQSPDAATTRHNLGSLLRRAGRYTEAIPLIESAIAILEEQLSPGHPHLTIARENLQKAIGESRDRPRGRKHKRAGLPS